MRSIVEIGNELNVIRRIDEQNRERVKLSDRPLVDKVFAAASAKRRSILERELADAKAEVLMSCLV